jgi:DNA-directed RNA polymerase subunit RPC12/RpoP
MTEESDTETYHCPHCNEEFEGYHYCDEGSDRVGYVCIDCGYRKNRDTHQLTLEGIKPRRCPTCSLDRMAEP